LTVCEIRSENCDEVLKYDHIAPALLQSVDHNDMAK